MVKLFNALGSETIYPRETLKAHVSVIPKEDKDPTSCGIYRPISLPNIDLKLFTKILASRLAQHLQDLIHLKQVKFILSREAWDNTVKVLNLLHVANKTHTPYVFFRTDAEKALDRVNW